VELGLSSGFNYAGNQIQRQMELSWDFELVNFWEGEIALARGGGTLNDRLTRGGPLTRQPLGHGVGAEIETDPRKRYSLSLGVEHEWNDAGGRSTEVGFDLAWRAAETWNIQIGPEFSRERTAAQYLTAISDVTATHTYDRRYVFSDLQQTELGLSTRLNVTFTPTVTLELYAQPLLASGNFGTPKELDAPRSFAFSRYGTDVGTLTEAQGQYVVDPDGAGPATSFRLRNRDFDVRELRGNAVLRWEYRPGSTLYVVWQQGRSSEIEGFRPNGDPAGRFDFVRGARDLLDLRPDNILMIKMTYWFNP
jgi:hypothetical protein